MSIEIINKIMLNDELEGKELKRQSDILGNDILVTNLSNIQQCMIEYGKRVLSNYLTQEHALILALCRCALLNATDATKHQMSRLQKYYQPESPDMAKKIEELLHIDQEIEEKFKIVKSANDEGSKPNRWNDSDLLDGMEFIGTCELNGNADLMKWYRYFIKKQLEKKSEN